MFADDDLDIVTAAVEAFIATDVKGFSPVIGIIKNKISEIKRPENITEFEAWSRVKQAISNGYYGCIEEFEKLPPILQRLVGSPNQLRDWATMSTETLNTVVASNFMRSYKARAIHEHEYAMLPGDVKKFISDFSDRMKFPESEKQLTEFEINERRNEIHRQLEGVT
jgi:hypothetical protein